MATIPNVQAPFPSPPAAGAQPGAAASSLGRISTLWFGLFVLVQAIEYGALHLYLPPLKPSRLSTILSYLLLLVVIARYKGLVMASRQAKLFATFVVFTGLSLLWAVVRSYVPLALRYHIDYFALFIITAFVVDTRQRATILAIMFVAISTLLVATNVNMLGQEVRAGSFAAAYFMGDGNDFGWGLIVLLPFALYLMIGRRRLLTRLYGLGGFAVGVIGIIGTESRGATLALAACMLLFWATVSKRKLLFAAALVVLVMGVALLAPPAYFERMNTIQNYEEDDSAMGRLRAWRAARQMALDYPLGVGANNFNSAYGRFYIPADTSGWAANRWMSTHSCYFKVLAEYGYPGLVLFLSILVVTFRDNVLSARRLRQANGAGVFEPEWPLLLNVAMVGYAVCAIFLGGIAYPHLYLLVGLTVATGRLSQQPLAAGTAAGTTAVPASTMTADAAAAPRVAPRRAPALVPRRPTDSGRFF
jgi:probable O-glycosylation ligase (exosortase A-associated)